MTLRKLMVASVAATTMSAPMLASAESAVSVAAPGAASAQVNLDFQIVIPSFIFFRIGTLGATIDTVDFDLQTAGVQPGSGAIGATSGGVSVELITNATNVRIAANNGNNGGTLTEVGGGTDTIPLSDITGSAGGAIPVPVFGNDTGLFSTIASPLSDTWTFQYANSTVVDAGTYGTSTNGGRVLYTATDI